MLLVMSDSGAFPVLRISPFHPHNIVSHDRYERVDTASPNRFYRRVHVISFSVATVT